MTTEPIEASAPPVVRFRTLGGAIVRVIRVNERTGDPDGWDPKFATQCAGCLAAYGSTRDPQDLFSSREWGAKHSATCRALPPVDTEAQSVSATYLEVARQLIERARTCAVENEAGKRQAQLLANLARSASAFALAAHQIEGV